MVFESVEITKRPFCVCVGKKRGKGEGGGGGGVLLTERLISFKHTN